MSVAGRRVLIGLVAALLVVVALMQAHLDPLRKKYQPGDVTNIELGGQMIAASLIGLKEVVAGLLWVRADEFFHTGNYEAIIPIVRIVTWLDPHQMSVYDTGAWHLAYNFTDSQERSDRRFIPAAKALLAEGIANNPTTYDMYFSAGWMNHQKILDFNESVKWLKQANTHPQVDPVTGVRKMRPQYVGHTLAHSMVRQGDIEGALEQWERNIRDDEKYYKQSPNDGGNRNMVEVAYKNRDRLANEIARRSKLKPVNNLNFEAHWQPISARKFRVWGTIGLKSGARIRLKLADKNFKEEVLKKFSWEVNEDQTILIDDLYVRDGKFERVIDVERDAAIYPFKAQKYEMTFTFNPLTAPEEAQEMLGWKGEGLAPQKYLVVRNGVRMLEKKFEIDRSQLL